MTDSGGSNKRLIDEFGLLPTSDIKQCLVALSPETAENSTLRQLFNYRFNQGSGVSGHHFGNLFMAALSDILGSQKAAIEKTQKILKIFGKIIPVSYEKADLIAEYEDGSVIKGENSIDEPKNHNPNLKITKLYTVPQIQANPDALQEIKEADLIILCSGDLYTSILANVVVDGIAKEIQKSKAKKAYIVNLMTKNGQTNSFTARDHIQEVEKYLGCFLDFILINNAKIPANVIKIYQKVNEIPVIDDLDMSHFKIIRGDFLNKCIVKKNGADNLKRSLIRHDSDKLAKALIKLNY